MQTTSRCNESSLEILMIEIEHNDVYMLDKLTILVFQFMIGIENCAVFWKMDKQTNEIHVQYARAFS